MAVPNYLRRCVCLLTALAATSGARAQDPWTLIGIGDTQVLVETVAGAQAFNNMTQWAVDNQETENVVFVTQLGERYFCLILRCSEKFQRFGFSLTTLRAGNLAARWIGPPKRKLQLCRVFGRAPTGGLPAKT